MLGQHEQLIWVLVVNSAATAWSVSDLTQVSQLACYVPSSTPVAGFMTGAASLSTVMKDSHACDPEPFDDDLDKRRGSLLQCQLGVHKLHENQLFNWLVERTALSCAWAMSSHTHLSSLSFDDFVGRFATAGPCGGRSSLQMQRQANQHIVPV